MTRDKNPPTCRTLVKREVEGCIPSMKPVVAVLLVGVVEPLLGGVATGVAVVVLLLLFMTGVTFCSGIGLLKPPC